MMQRKPMKRGIGFKAKPKARRVANPLKENAVGKSAVSKRPLKDLKHRQRVNSMRCTVCQARPFYPCEAHHIRECFPRTMGRRIGDENVVPLCSLCHSQLHRGSNTFWQRVGINPVPIAAALYAETLAQRKRSSP
jgi:hypothetical protein